MDQQENQGPDKNGTFQFNEIGAVIQHTDEVIFVIDREMRLVYGNEAFDEMAKQRAEVPGPDYMGKGLFELFPLLTPLMRKRYREVFDTGKASKNVEDIEVRGEYFAFNMRRMPLFREGKVWAVLTILRNITRQTRLEEESRANQELLKATLESTADGILVVGRDNEVTHYNKRFTQMWGIPEEIMATRDDARLREFVLDQLEDPGAFLARIEKLYNSREQGSDTLHFGDGRVFERFSSPLIQNGEAAGRVWSFRDISEQKHTEEMLKQSGELARQQKRSIMKLVSSELIVTEGLDSALEQLTEEASAALDVDRASVWLFHRDGRELRCVDLFQRKLGLHSKDMVLHSHRYPGYFAALGSQQVVDAGDALMDQRTRKFADDYLAPLGISSMLDASIRVAGTVVGVVCLEHTGRKRDWGQDEMGFARELATQVSKLLIERDRQQAERVRNVVYDISRASNAARDLDEFFGLIKEKLASVLDTTNFFIVFYDRETDTLSLPFFVDEKDSFSSFPAEKTLTAHMIQQGKPLLISGEGIQELAKKGIIDIVGTPSKSWLGVPLKLDSEIIGAVVVQSYTDTVTYTEDEMDILQFVSEQIAVAIHRRRAEEELMQEKAHLEELLENSPEAIVVTDNNGIVQRINSEFCELFDYSEKEAVGSHIDKLVAKGEEHYQEATDNTRKVAQGDRVVAETVRYRKNGDPVHVSILGSPITTEDGQIAIYSIYRDIGERKRNELKLREKTRQLLFQKQLWEDTFNAMAEGISVHDENYRITRVNDALCRLLGKTREEIIGRPCYEIFHQRDEQPPFCPMKRSLARRSQAMEEIFEPSLGKYLLITSSPILGQGGREQQQLIGVIHSIQDITELKEREKKLEELNVELKAADKQKSEFVSIVSHDFGNPLGVIQGNIELMLLGAYGELEPKLKTKLETIQNTTKRLNRLRKDTLDLAKMDLGQMELELRKDDLHKLVQSVMDQTRDMAEKKGQTLEFESPGSMLLSYDPVRIYQVVENYLSNAVRYTPEGGTIQLSLSELGSEVMLCVTDDGRGIPEDELENVFRRFYRIGERVRGSTGLGLSIVRGIISAHGGKCWAESDGLGRGSTFCFTLPKN